MIERVHGKAVALSEYIPGNAMRVRDAVQITRGESTTYTSNLGFGTLLYKISFRCSNKTAKDANAR